MELSVTFILHGIGTRRILPSTEERTLLMKRKFLLIFLGFFFACDDESNQAKNSFKSINPTSARGGSAGQPLGGEAGSASSGKGGQSASGQGGISPAGGYGGTSSAGVAGKSGEEGAPLTCEQLPVLVGKCDTCAPLVGEYINISKKCRLDGTVGCVDHLEMGLGEFFSMRIHLDADGNVDACLISPSEIVTEIPGWISPVGTPLGAWYDTCVELRDEGPTCAPGDF
jgi:hypothetical protein